MLSVPEWPIPKSLFRIRRDGGRSAGCERCSQVAGIETDYVGEFSTEPALFEDSQIEINARTTRVGSVEYDLRENGSPLAGFTSDDCVPFRGDELWSKCRWKGKSDLEGLRGKQLEVAFRLTAAKIFAYLFV